MQVCLVQHALEVKGRLNLNERTIQPGNLAHQFISGQYDFYVFSVGGVKQGVRQTLLQAGSFCVAAVCRQKIGAKHQKQSKKENDKRYKHRDYISSKNTRGNWRPHDLSRSAKRGRIPVG